MMIESVRKIKFTGGSFTSATELPIFRNQNQRMSLVYGRNGSGKTTIAKAFIKVNGGDVSDIDSAALLDENGNPVVQGTDDATRRVYVFNEEYIQRNVRLKEDGLSTIIMLGAQAELEEKIIAAQSALTASENARKQQEEVCNTYSDRSSVLAPAYYLAQMNNALSGDTHWAGRERVIKEDRRNASVNDSTYKTIISSAPALSVADVECEYSKKLAMLSAAKSGSATISQSVQVHIPGFRDDDIIMILAERIEKPELTPREEFLLTLVESGQLQKIEETFSNEAVKQCPFCLQPVTEEYKNNLIESIKKVLSRQVEDHKECLSKLIIQQISFDITPFSKLNQSTVNNVINAVAALNDAIEKCNTEIKKKIANPFEPILGVEFVLQEKRAALVSAISDLEAARIEHNKPFRDISKIKSELQMLNKQKAYYEILPIHATYLKQLKEKEDADSKFKQLKEDALTKKKTLDELLAQKKNIMIAVDVINSNLRYIFFANDRLAIKVKDGVYLLQSNKADVKPNEISLGERNIIALCYFFAEMLSGCAIEDAYTNEVLVIIDDPVSSFDFENKIGIISFLRSQMRKIMCGNRNSKLLVMTHDLPAVFDLEKAFNEIRATAKDEIGTECNYLLLELENRQLVDFRYKKRHEYSELLKTIYDFAVNGTPENDMIIGNTMRRALETFSTFVYKKPIDAISCDKDILSLLGEECYVTYFENLMYRLVLNGESHMEERAKTLVDADFVAVLSPDEKKRTARDILCFMYLLNTVHVKAHLADINDAECQIQGWCSNIKEFA
ncbi:AAA family ATPase [Fusobacterium naviforme]|nr:AAA family ATPase [Fusobacterium naviforme]